MLLIGESDNWSIHILVVRLYKLLFCNSEYRQGIRTRNLNYSVLLSCSASTIAQNINLSRLSFWCGDPTIYMGNKQRPNTLWSPCIEEPNSVPLHSLLPIYLGNDMGRLYFYLRPVQLYYQRVAGPGVFWGWLMTAWKLPVIPAVHWTSMPFLYVYEPYRVHNNRQLQGRLGQEVVCWFTSLSSPVHSHPLFSLLWQRTV